MRTLVLSRCMLTHQPSSCSLVVAWALPHDLLSSLSSFVTQAHSRRPVQRRFQVLAVPCTALHALAPPATLVSPVGAMSDPSKLAQQELVDYLVQAVEEEDVLFCVLWLQEMARRGLVCSRDGELKADGINFERASSSRSLLPRAA